MTNPSIINGERLARVETEMRVVIESQTASKHEVAEINRKLDDLLALRDKGIGAFWLATSLAGAGVISIFFQVLGWLGLRH